MRERARTPEARMLVLARAWRMAALRRRAVAVVLALFVALWLALLVQLIVGRDPGLTSKPQASAAVTSAQDARRRAARAGGDRLTAKPDRQSQSDSSSPDPSTRAAPDARSVPEPDDEGTPASGATAQQSGSPAPGAPSTSAPAPAPSVPAPAPVVTGQS